MYALVNLHVLVVGIKCLKMKEVIGTSLPLSQKRAPSSLACSLKETLLPPMFGIGYTLFFQYKESEFFLSQSIENLTKIIDKIIKIYHTKEINYQTICYNVFVNLMS